MRPGKGSGADRADEVPPEGGPGQVVLVAVAGGGVSLYRLPCVEPLLGRGNGKSSRAAPKLKGLT